MRELLILSMATFAGLAVGVVFFGGLWWTVRRGMSSPRPVLWFAGSLLIRMAVVLVTFYVIAISGDWRRLLACMAGFVMARLVVTWRTRLLPEITRAS